MLPVYVTSLKLLFLVAIFSKTSGFYITSPANYASLPKQRPLFASKNQLKGARKFSRNRPKKKRPSAVYPSPTLYYGNVQDYFGAPPEYLAVPVDSTLNLLRNGPLHELLSILHKGTTGQELSKILSTGSFRLDLSKELGQLKTIAKTMSCDVTSDLVIYLERIINSPEQHEHFIDRFYTLNRLHTFWELRETNRYNRMLKRIFLRLRSIAFKMKNVGIPLKDFTTPELWHKYGVFKTLPNNTMVDNYLSKHRVALKCNIKGLYFRNRETNKISSKFDDPDFISTICSGEGTSEVVCDEEDIEPENHLSPEYIERITMDLKDLKLLSDDCTKLNMSRVDELQRDLDTLDSQKAYAIRDYYLSWKYSDYSVVSSPYILESFVDHRYRTKTLERDLLVKYKGWLRHGAPRHKPKPMNLKYRHLAIWHGLSKNKRRFLAREYVRTLTTK
ncbi:signal peptide-containing protein [Theileria equi strain WA]|uniref:Signal peptide-containing protein n=1 Tax=Theileria equi strain WA TaxID=1537102 RepID=L0AYF7_THEEQ|nr:signal peptide-containing protein [Theileria equi strain WA]AFZ80600.1 signal peptide-containing protein [Theileria equi strain WA]|eukprot:XP_004830266.1 signal peptide-containing protein [Theileria equi strain WA]